MPAKEIKYDLDARERIMRGVQTLANGFEATLGPEGRNVVIAKSWGAQIDKDGVTVVEEIELDDKFENMGAQMVKEAASNTSDKACIIDPAKVARFALQNAASVAEKPKKKTPPGMGDYEQDSSKFNTGPAFVPIRATDREKSGRYLSGRFNNNSEVSRS